MFLAERVSSCILYIIYMYVVAKRSGFPLCLCASPQERKVKERNQYEYRFGGEKEIKTKLINSKQVETSKSETSRKKTKLFLMH